MTDDGLPPDGPAPDETGARHRPGIYGLAKSGFIEYDRVLFFSDAVFAIAITVLAVNLHVPADGQDLSISRLLGDVGSGLLAFGISFAVIGLFWLGHHGIFRYITAFDRPLIVLNLLFLGTVAFLPFPTEVLSVSGTDRAGAEIFYAASVAAAGLVEGLIWQYAAASPDLTSPEAARIRRFFTLRIARIPVVFLISIPIAVLAPKAATYVWILAWILGILINRLAPGPGAPGRER